VLQTYKLGQLMPSSVPSGIIIDELPTIYFGRIRYFIRVAGGSKMAICLGLQDYSQLKRDYGEEECKTMTNGIDVFGAIGNIFSGHALGDTARDLQERFEEVLQQKRQNTRANWRDTMECPISAEKIFNLPQGTFVGNVAEDLKMVDEHGQPVEGMVQNIFHAKIMVDQNEAKAAEKSYQELPIVADFVRDGKDCMEDIIRANFEQIKQDVEQIIKQFS
jgi:hypothetical protein